MGCSWCGSVEELCQGRCLACHGQVILEAIGYKGTWRDYEILLDSLDKRTDLAQAPFN